MIALLSLKLRNIPYYYELDGAMIGYGESKMKHLFKSFFYKVQKDI